MGAGRGFLMVKLWWIDGDSWCVDGRILRDEKYANFFGFILGWVWITPCCPSIRSVFGDVGGAFEVEFVAVGIGEDGDPHGVADKGVARLETAGRWLRGRWRGRLCVGSRRGLLRSALTRQGTRVRRYSCSMMAALGDPSQHHRLVVDDPLFGAPGSRGRRCRSGGRLPMLVTAGGRLVLRLGPFSGVNCLLPCRF